MGGCTTTRKLGVSATGTVGPGPDARPKWPSFRRSKASPRAREASDRAWRRAVPQSGSLGRGAAFAALHLVHPPAVVLLRPVEIDLAGAHRVEGALHADRADVDV